MNVTLQPVFGRLPLFFRVTGRGGSATVQNADREHSNVERYVKAVSEYEQKGALPKNCSFYPGFLTDASAASCAATSIDFEDEFHVMAIPFYEIVTSVDFERNPLGYYMREVRIARKIAELGLRVLNSSPDENLPGFGVSIPQGYWITNDKYGSVPRIQFPKGFDFKLWDALLKKQSGDVKKTASFFTPSSKRTRGFFLPNLEYQDYRKRSLCVNGGVTYKKMCGKPTDGGCRCLDCRLKYNEYQDRKREMKKNKTLAEQMLKSAGLMLIISNAKGDLISNPPTDYDLEKSKKEFLEDCARCFDHVMIMFKGIPDNDYK